MHNIEWLLLAKASWETIYIVFIASTFSVIAGSLVGLILFLTGPRQALHNKTLHHSLNLIVNITRSVPFVILMISILPLTRLLVGTTIGSNAAIVPLALAAVPFFARVCESAFSEVPYGLIETAHSLGATTFQLVTKVLIPESLPSLIRGITLTIVALIGYSTMAGAVGGGGLGELAINYGYQRFDVWVTLETVIILIVLVQLIQWWGDYLAKQRRFNSALVGGVVLSVLCAFSQGYPLLKNPEPSLRVGVTAGWPEEVMKVAQKTAAKQYGLKIEIVTFNDYVLPNTALANGNIDANIFQHVPYLEAQLKSTHAKLIPIAKTFVYPLGFYSRRIKQVTEIGANALIALPNDPSNEARSLLLLQKVGLISLKSGAGALASLKDIVANPKHLQFKLMDAAQLPRVMNDADLVALTNDFIAPAGLTIEQAVIKEGADSLYANVIAVREADKANPLVAQLVEVIHSAPVVAATQAMFPHGAAIAAWR